MNLSQIKHEVISPALSFVGYNTTASLSLVCGTGNKESGYRTKTQYGGGPAKSWFQIERPTYNDVLNRAVSKRPLLKNKIIEYLNGNDPSFDLLTENDGFAAIVCRLKYLLIPEELPSYDDAASMAKYWKKYYNTYLGKGSVDSETIRLFKEAIEA